MDGTDLVLDASHTPTYDEIFCYMDKTAQGLWEGLHTFIQNQYKASPKITYSKCSGKPGWNVKYHKSGKSICTLYPERDGFVVLVVITLDLLSVIEKISHEFEDDLIKQIQSAKPFNGTLWLMIQTNRKTVLDNIKQLLLLKYGTKH